MKSLKKSVYSLVGVNGSQKVKVVFFVLTLVLFVIGAGAPEAGSGIGN
jgi:hypothetical protein